MGIKEVVIGIAIIILTSFVAVYGISMFYPEVEYNDFCGEMKTQELIETQERCEEIGGGWEAIETIKIPESDEMTGFCDRNYQCRQDYDEARKIRSKKIFIFSIPLGIIIIALGAFLFSLESVGAGLMGGGAFTLVYGAGNYWRYGEDWFRFLLSLIGLIAVILIAYWFNKKFDKKRQ